MTEKRYVKGNVRLVTYHVNVALAKFGLSELEKLAKQVLNLNIEEIDG